MELIHTDVLVIGSGPSGLFTSIISSQKRKVLLLEKPNKTSTLSKRILVSGNGRANFFNEDLFSSDFEYSYLIRDEKEDCAKEFFSYLDKNGFAYLKEDNLYYPYFKRSECLHSFLLNKMKDVEVLFALACKIEPDKNRVIALYQGKRIIIEYTDLVLSIGGRSFDRDDYSYDLLNSLDVKYYPYESMLCPIKTKEKIPSYLSKQRLRMRLILKTKEKILYQEEGEILFKDDGLSGISVFNSTKYLLDEKRKYHKNDFIYEIDYGFDGLNKNADITCYPNFLSRYIKENHLKLDEPLIFHFDSLYPFKESQASYGGILLSEIDMKSMSLKKHPNVIVLGEMLDINLICGGYNIGMSFILGLKAGRRLLTYGNTKR